MKMFAAALLIAIVTMVSSANAAAVFEITESYIGTSGEDGTNDWFEVSNLGDMVGSTGGLFYDDGSADPTNNFALTAFDLNPGESAVFLIEAGSPTDFTDFESVWGLIDNLGTAGSGGGLGGSGDTVNIFDGNTADAAIVDSATYDSTFDDLVTTIQFSPSGIASNSLLGVAGAYESNEFFNDNIGGDDELISLIGSPGFFEAVPEPTSALLLVVASVAMSVRSRR